ncbi:MAG TPA: PQQ-dependent sugar dehydrogenase [Candidatus Limnocylindria bacterium]|nr:PQQ-dependent sugar dehydrogenase [Candidatus Limnocylindria bacterium]
MRHALRAVILVASLVCGALGSPLTAAAAEGFHSAWIDQSPWPVLRPGTTISYTLHFRNTGTQAWQRGVAGRHVNLAVSGDSTAFADAGMAAGWLSANRVATTTEASVAPNAIATFTFLIRAPAAPGPYRLPLHPVLEGVQHLEDEGVFVVVVSDLGFHSSWVSQSPYPTLQPGQTSGALNVVFRNTGSQTWTKGVLGQEARLGINRDDAQWAPLGVSWLSVNRLAAQSEASVPPGALATFAFQVRAPQAPGTYQLHLRPVVDGAWWMEDQGVFLLITIPPAGSVPRLVPAVVQFGLRVPWDVAFAPDGRMFVTERVGNILVYASALPGASQLANAGVPNIRASGEAGLMGIELDPAFAVNGLLYVCASVTEGGQWVNQVLRFRMNGNTPVFDRHVIRNGMAANSNHDGCRIRFGPDGKLWVTMGDAGNTANGQNPNALNGKVLRVNSDGTIPADNPIMPGASARTAVYTMGNRNPQGLTFEPGTGRPIEVEHGDDTHDEINALRAGANYGYPVCRGPCADPRFVNPIWSSGNATIATSGADFARGVQWGAWEGSLFVGQLKDTDLRRFTISGDVATQRDILFDGTYGRIRTVRLGPDGSLYLTTSNGSADRVVRITPTQ